MERRLAAILATDVVGYSRLIRADEEGTLVALKALRADLLDPRIIAHHGRVFKLMGDGMLAEFPSAVDAVRAAVEAQQALLKYNADLPKETRFEFRMGINLGDVVIDGDDIQGDGVNVAARLEGLAAPGGLCISGGVHEQVRDRIELPFEDLGERQVKNIDRPIQVWQWLPAMPVAPAASPDTLLPLPEKPSIAVLPFENMSKDPEQEFLADGIAEDLLTNLSHIHELLVIARNSSFSYKGQHPDVRQVARDLGVHYVLEGSVRSAGTRVRITAQLINGADGSHLWAERYDRDLSDIFALQDEITSKIANALEVRLTEGQQARTRRDQTASIPAWQALQQAQHHMRRFTPGDNALARELAEAAVEHDPRFVSALALLAWTYISETRLPWNASRDEALAKGLKVIDQAMAITTENPDVLAMLGGFKLLQGHHEEAEAIQRKAVALGPNIADNRIPLALTLNMRNKPAEAAGFMDEAMRLCPVFPDLYLGMVGISYRLLKRYDDAIDTDRRRLKMNPNNVFSDIRLAAVYVEIDEMDLARQHVVEALKKRPMYRISHLSRSDPYEDPVLMQQYEDLLRRAGLPE